MCVLCWDKPFGKIQSPSESKGMYLFDLKMPRKVLGKLPCQVIKWYNHVVFCHYDMLNVWWKSNMAWKCWTEWLRRWKNHHSKHEKRCQLAMLTSSSDTTQIKEPLQGLGMKMQDQTIRPESDVYRAVKSQRPGSVWMQPPCLFMLLRRSSLKGEDVTEHALKCLLRSLFLSSIRLCMGNIDEGPLQKMC